QKFAARFAEALDGADEVIVCDIFPAREQPIPGVTAALITEHMRHGQYVGDRDAAARALARRARPGDMILTMGAGDITAAGELILAQLEAEQ
ncbi:MAG: UDP-N-acetylmuramate--L-alanine ligase, partial [Bowdeniella nasicola]|nr:UDP-N-acetylmuramate--L-alanine ligase [Bowdeniella nasicola]